ncbi:MAG: radical SAM protein [Deltaproteobacteria bacterium]|nr:radical SAM protein [Deltaproteobacteria bacterium]
MQILLISANREKTPYPVSPIGLAYIASALIKDNHDVEILDLCFAEDVISSLKQTIARFKPDIIGLSIRNIDNLTYPKSVFYLPYIKSVVDEIKQTCLSRRDGRQVDIPLVMGGSGFSLFPEGVLRYTGLEFGIVGEGENGFCEFVKRQERNKWVYDIPNLAYLKGDRFIQNPIAFTSGFSKPDRLFLDNERYFQFGGMANIQTKRGCPFKCIYCTYPYLDGSRIRCRDVDDIVDEVEELVNKYGIDYIFFVDDIFNQPVGHAMDICRGIIKRGLKINWTCFATPKGMTPELLSLMKDAGCMGVEFGTDAASAETLRSMGKSFTPDDVRRVSIMCDDAGLEAAHYLIFGGPGETEKTLEESFAFMDENNPRAVIAMTGLRIYPNTGLEKMSLAQGVIKNGEDILHPHFYISPAIGEERLLSMVKDHAISQPNWIVPGLDIRNSEETMTVLRKFGNRGPLWNMLKKNVKYQSSNVKTSKSKDYDVSK